MHRNALDPVVLITVRIDGGIWRRTEAYGGVRRRVEAYGGVWKRTEACGSVWSLNYGGLWRRTDSYTNATTATFIKLSNER